MREVRDTFLHYVADNLEGLEVHPLIRTPVDQSLDALKMNCINVSFEDLNLNSDISEYYVVIDVIYDDEMTAVDAVAALWRVLRGCMTPLVSYVDPSLQVQGNVCWERSDIRFLRVVNDSYIHFSCVMPLRFHSD